MSNQVALGIVDRFRKKIKRSQGNKNGQVCDLPAAYPAPARICHRHSFYASNVAPTQAGVQLVVVAYIATREIVTHSIEGTELHFSSGDTLPLEPILLGFACPVADIFAV